MLDGNIYIGIVGLCLTIFASVGSLTWWLSGQFTAIRNLIYTQIEKVYNNLSAKLDYHEKHDDNRFSNLDVRMASIRDDIWDIRVRDAAVRGIITKTTGSVTPVVKELQKHFQEEGTNN